MESEEKWNFMEAGNKSTGQVCSVRRDGGQEKESNRESSSKTSREDSKKSSYSLQGDTLVS